MASKKVIFLDVDGVICIDRKLSNSCIENLKCIIENTGAEIVLSSNWRLHEKYYKKLVSFLKHYDLTIQSQTSSLKDRRCLEIWIWCKKNKPDICVILDDRKLDSESFGAYVKNCFVKTDPNVGLIKGQVSEIINMLNRNTLIKNEWYLTQTRKKKLF